VLRLASRDDVLEAVRDVAADSTKSLVSKSYVRQAHLGVQTRSRAGNRI